MIVSMGYAGCSSHGIGHLLVKHERSTTYTQEPPHHTQLQFYDEIKIPVHLSRAGKYSGGQVPIKVKRVYNVQQGDIEMRVFISDGGHSNRMRRF